MSDKKELEAKPNTSDPELDELLDSALEDLTKGVNVKETKTEVAKTVGTDPREKDEEWTDEYIKQAAQHFEANMARFLSAATRQEPADISQSQIEKNLQKMAEAAAQVIQNPHSVEPTAQSNDFSATITQTLQNLSLGAENLQNPFSENDLLGMFGNESENGFLPFMQGMMQSLLSKEVLYPSLKDILDKYPAWLTENQSKITKAEFDRYTKQKDLMKEVCDELEQESETDGENTKRERFDRVLNLMQKMQDLGQPPTDLVGKLGPQLQFDENGRPIIPEGIDINNLESLCCIM